MTQDFSGPSHSLAIKFDQTLETNFNTNGHALQLAAPKSGLNGAVKWNVTRRKQGRPFDLWDIVGQVALQANGRPSQHRHRRPRPQGQSVGRSPAQTII